MSCRDPDIVDPLILDKLFAIPDAVIGFADGQRRRRMAANEFVAFLIFGDARIFQEHQIIRLQQFSKARGLDWREAAMDIMEQMDITAQFFPCTRK